jgi:hypothetical protein
LLCAAALSLSACPGWDPNDLDNWGHPSIGHHKQKHHHMKEEDAGMEDGGVEQDSGTSCVDPPGETAGTSGAW